MGLFERFHLSSADAEKKLKRPVAGDPSRGEQAVLAALNADRIDDARRLMERDPDIGSDFRELLDEHLRRAVARAGQVKSWNVALPLPVWDDYARLARVAKIPISDALAAAVQRDFDRRREALEPLDALDENVRAYHRAAVELMKDVRQLHDRLGPIQDLSMRLGRIEAALATTSRR
jgi:hypothetical protein